MLRGLTPPPLSVVAIQHELGVIARRIEELESERDALLMQLPRAPLAPPSRAGPSALERAWLRGYLLPRRRRVHHHHHHRRHRRHHHYDHRHLPSVQK